MSMLQFLGCLVLVSYVIVIADVFKWFRLPQTSGSYFESPYWVGMPPDYGMLTTVCQVLAVVGLLGWFSWRSTLSPTDTIVTHKMADASVYVLIISSLLWPYLTYFALRHGHILYKTLSVISLVVTAISSIVMLAFTFEQRAPLPYLIGMLVFCIVTVLIDGVGWSVMFLSQN